MPTQELLKETVTVAQVGQYGVRVGDEWFGVNEPLDPSSFIPGKTYNVLYKRGKASPKYPQGKAYISQIVGESTPTVASNVVNQTLPTPPTFKSQDNDTKSIRILRQGVFQATLQSPALPGFAATPDEYVALVKNIAEQIITAIEEK